MQDKNSREKAKKVAPAATVKEAEGSDGGTLILAPRPS